jgi:hypothetical protein
VLRRAKRYGALATDHRAYFHLQFSLQAKATKRSFEPELKRKREHAHHAVRVGDPTAEVVDRKLAILRSSKQPGEVKQQSKKEAATKQGQTSASASNSAFEHGGGIRKPISCMHRKKSDSLRARKKQ